MLKAKIFKYENNYSLVFLSSIFLKISYFITLKTSQYFASTTGGLLTNV